MASSAFDKLRDGLASRGSAIRDERQNHFMAQCPAHDDRNPSLAVDDHGEHALVYCHAGCHTDEVMAALEMEVRDLFDGEVQNDGLRGALIRSYLYRKTNGEPWFYVDRYYPKTFRQRMPDVQPVRSLADANERKRLGLRNRDPILYHADTVWKCMRQGGCTVWLLDGEKDVETAEKHGLVATCPPGFGKQWRDSYGKFLRHAETIVIVKDQDDDKPDGSLPAGHMIALGWRAGLKAMGVNVRIVAPAAGKDLSDHFAAGYGVDDFKADPSVYTRPRGLPASELRDAEFEPLKWVVDRILPSGLTICSAAPKIGKALWVDTPILTTDGWTTMGRVEAGQYVYSAKGEPTRVVAVTDVMRNHNCYRVTTRSGASVVADAEHQWVVHQRSGEAIVATADLGRGMNGRRWLLPVSEAVLSPGIDLPIDPWLLGYWLANGACACGVLSCHPADRDQVLARVEAAGYQVGRMNQDTISVLGLLVQLRDLGVLGDKHIPERYLVAGTEQRRALLTGLCDGDGYARTTAKGGGQLELTQIREGLLTQAAYLARSLGFKVCVHKGVAMLNGVDVGPKYRMVLAVSRTDAPVSLTRRVEALPDLEPTQRTRRDAVVSVERVPTVPVRCIQVEDPSGTYLAGPDLMVTHNSWLALDLCVGVACGGVALSTLEARQGSALYLAREDTFRRLQSRMELLLGGREPWPKALELVPAERDWTGGDEGLANLTEWAEEVRDPSLVVLDTLAKVEPEMGEDGRRGAYAGNYSMMAKYKEWADRHNCAVLMVHHDRKQGSKPDGGGMANDPFSKISGTRGLSGAADTLWFLEKERGSREGFLHVTGRDVEEDTVDLVKAGPIWQAI